MSMATAPAVAETPVTMTGRCGGDVDAIVSLEPVPALPEHGIRRILPDSRNDSPAQPVDSRVPDAMLCPDLKDISSDSYGNGRMIAPRGGFRDSK